MGKKRQEKYQKRKAAAKRAMKEQKKKKHTELALKQAIKKKKAEKKLKAARAQRARRAAALRRARAAAARKERARKNRVVRRCTSTNAWANCTAHPISWYTNCKGAGTSRPTWKRCGFMNAGGQYLCKRTTCRMVRVRI